MEKVRKKIYHPAGAGHQIAWFDLARLNIAGLFVLTLLICFSPKLNAQQSNTLFLMHDIPQSNLMNPAVQLSCKWFIGLPVLGTSHASVSNTAFSVNSFFANGEVNFDEAYLKLDRMNMISAEVLTYPILLGYRNGFNYFTFSVSDRVSSYNTFSRNLAGLALYGNSQYVGQTIRINNTRVNASYYREYSAGWSFGWDRYTTFGIKGKLLFGKAGIHSGASRFLLGTDKDTYDLTVRGAMSFSSSFPLTVTQNSRGIITNLAVPELEYLRLLMNPRNVGLAADFGVIHTYSKELTLSASVLDFGAILWTDETDNISGDVDFLHEGVSNSVDFSAAAYYRELADSIRNDILYDVSERSYLSPLPLQVFLGAEYQWKKNITLGVVSRNLFTNRRVYPSLTVSANARVLDRMSFSLSWSYLDRSFTNIGTGIAYTGKGMQVYLVTDNVIGLIMPLDTHTVNFRFGMNLMLGCPRDPKAARQDPKHMPMGKCAWMERERGKKRPRRF